ncbi:MAG: UDP-N-acetylmuramoyl-L-alanine--D-glutamate ligase [Candidatus Sungbacteria bacterium]|uniref:UDP-N-acetylmuramoylalanine--D-glutamate ligase n=1 Tax=Candidatus Sungiibacteriota bacterium TaxID=2750080 RepID=A0A931SAW8_9BACT|nr:UDP-N-acetylmuramoyl-L-alanine--D-glutamate ligase [Candidatus Sungbacteria bacterium]
MFSFRGKRITVIGLGLHGGGLGAVRFLLREGAREICITDLRDRKTLAPTMRRIPRRSNIRYVLGKHRFKDFENRDAIIKNPGVPYSSPYLRHARKRGIPVLTDISIFFERVERPIIGVTGTKGKSTTTALIALLLRSHFKRVVYGGNIRKSVLDLLDEAQKADCIVLELSSFQLEDLALIRKSPQIAVITSFSPDHLNRYRSLAEYKKAKTYITRFQQPGDCVIIPRGRGLQGFLAHVKAKKIQVAAESKQRASMSKLNPALVAHMADAALLALSVAKLLKVPLSKCKRALRKFKPLEGRMQLIRVKRGVRFVNDTSATTPTAAAADVAIMARRGAIILIAGGVDKGGMPFGILARAIERHAARVYLLPGDASDQITSHLKNEAQKKVTSAASMGEAVRKAFGAAEYGDIILLSPGAASFNLFHHEFHRGNEFKRAVDKLPT